MCTEILESPCPPRQVIRKKLNQKSCLKSSFLSISWRRALGEHSPTSHHDVCAGEMRYQAVSGQSVTFLRFSSCHNSRIFVLLP